MTDHKLSIARTMATHLFATEEAIDAALREAAGLAGFMPVARQQARVSAAVGQNAIEHIIGTMTMLSEARRRIVETHRDFSETQAQAGIPARNFGGFVDKPRHDRASADLSVVPITAQAA